MRAWGFPAPRKRTAACALRGRVVTTAPIRKPRLRNARAKLRPTRPAPTTAIVVGIADAILARCSAREGENNLAHLWTGLLALIALGWIAACVILARLRGAVPVLCIGAPELRLRCALDVGAAAVLDFTNTAAAAQQEWVREHTQGRGADLVIEATGDPAAVTGAMRCARDGGRVVVVGQYTDHGETTFNPHLDLNQKHLELRGCWGSDFSHFYRAAALLLDPESRSVWETIPARTYGLEQLDAALDDMAAGNVVKALVNPRGGAS